MSRSTPASESLKGSNPLGRESATPPPRMYHDLAHLWPLISPPGNYEDEARQWREALRESLGPGRHHLLELGVGGGHNLSHLTSEFNATAVDISPAMLENSRRLNPGVEHCVGDMRTVRLGRTFNAVLIHDAIAYLRSEDDLSATFMTARAHLEPGGVLLIAPDWFRETFAPGVEARGPRVDGGTELSYVEYVHDPDPADTTIESVFVYLIKTGGEVQVEVDRHITGLFPRSVWLDRMHGAGFDAEAFPHPVHGDGRPGHLVRGIAR